MKYLMIVSSMVLGLAMPVLAQDQSPATDSAKQQGTVQPPPNRLDKLVPPMKESNQSNPTTPNPASSADPSSSGSSGAASGEEGKSQQAPPTKAIGKAVPNMKSPNATDDLPSEQPAEPAPAK